MSDARASMYVDGKTRLFGVYGHPIGHTFSPKIHELLIQEYGENMAYAAYHVLPEHLGEALKGAWAMNIQGLNLTISCGHLSRSQTGRRGQHTEVDA